MQLAIITCVFLFERHFSEINDLILEFRVKYLQLPYFWVKDAIQRINTTLNIQLK